MATRYTDPQADTKDFSTGTVYEEFTYPYDNTNRYGGEIMFEVHRVIPPTINLEEDYRGKLKKSFTDSKLGQALTGKNEEREKQTVKSEDAPNLVKSIQPGTVEPTGRTIYMYLPVAFSVNDGLVYDTPSLGIRGGLLADELQGNSGALSSVASATLAGFQSIADLFTGGLTGDVARLGLARAAQSTRLDDRVQKAIGLGARVSINPNIRSTFSNVAIREFTFQFKFIPTSPREAEEVENIIACFRENAYPEDIAIDQFQTAGFEYPNLFSIRLGHYDPNTTDSVQVGTKIKKCFLRSIQTNYNPSSMAFHEDGKPVEYDLSLNFVEHKTLSRKDIKEGY